jgi:tryptophan halogenase
MQVRSILVLGGGSAGFLSAITIKSKHPDLPVTVLRSKEIGIIGVGEGTIQSMPYHLHGYVGVDLARFYREAQPTWKLGIWFIWGPRPYFHYTFTTQCDSRYLKLSKNTGFYYTDMLQDGNLVSSLMAENKVFARQPNGAPLVDHAAYHLENELLVRFLEGYATEMGIEIVEDTVAEVQQNEQGVAGLQLASGRTMAADLYIDCSGFRSVLLGKTLGVPFRSFSSSLFCDRAIVGGWQRGDDEPIKPYTTAETMDAGWCWQIEHEHHITRGYVHSSAFMTEEEAEREMRAKNPRLGPTRVVKFVTGCYEQAWVKNVVAIGNSSGFVEPLESTSLAVICADAQTVTEVLRDQGGRITPSHIRGFNERTAASWRTIRQFLALHYKFNTRLETPFWRACRADVDLAGAEPIVDYYRENGPSTLYRTTLIDEMDQFHYDGYLAMLVGQQVPHEAKFVPTDEEREVWRQIQAANRAKARQGFTVAEALSTIRLPQWQWDQDFYKRLYPLA